MNNVTHDTLSENLLLHKTSLSALRDWLMIVNKVRC